MLPAVLAITLLCSTTSNSYGGWLTDLLKQWFGSGDSSGENADPIINGGEPVPTIANNNESAEFLLTILVDEAQTHGEDAAEAADNYDGYATKLAKVMSQLSPDEQRIVFYGSL